MQWEKLYCFRAKPVGAGRHTFLRGRPPRRKGRRTLQSEYQSPMMTAATANRSIVFEPNDLLLLAAYEAVGKASVEEGRAKWKV